MTNPNDPVFPIQSGVGMASLGNSRGLTKREYFAAMAMQGMLSAFVVPLEGIEEKLAISALKYTDALIAELSKDSK